MILMVASMIFYMSIWHYYFRISSKRIHKRTNITIFNQKYINTLHSQRVDIQYEYKHIKITAIMSGDSLRNILKVKCIITTCQRICCVSPNKIAADARRQFNSGLPGIVRHLTIFHFYHTRWMKNAALYLL